MRIAHPRRVLIPVIQLHFPHISPSKLFKPFSHSFSLQQAPALIPNMASENLSTFPADDENFGFRRPEMYQSNLAGTVSAYDRHMFLCYKSPEDWASRVESSDLDPLPKLLASALKARKDDITVKTMLTIFEGREGTGFSDGEVLIFPELIKYRGLKDSDVDGFVEDVLVNGKPWAYGVPEVLSGSHVFVCAHASRDKRCGVCGPVLIEKFGTEIEHRGLKDQVLVSPCSHIGGHKYAGNLVIFSPGPDGKITGHWYGYVTPDDVPELLDQHIAKGEIIQRLWRGQMGASTEEGKQEDVQKLPSGEDSKKSNGNHVESDGLGKVETVAGCCQGANGVSCCRDGGFEQNGEIKETKLKETTTAHDNLGRCKLSSWFGTWDQSDVYTAATVVGAVATIAVAFSVYRRSG
ncbi:altered inheritance of mitochondria protein 32-like [Quillaja saponaria]|uniref:Altered inheritance of mitochondria protein 32-like n=1 Tax=Quillaja saponaria TaxID=32244 RepID=A0AAD7VGH0_QUISA|nr:altered inheritance of mitochondria protein 32-like [Quillaja saponaria]